MNPSRRTPLTLLLGLFAVAGCDAAPPSATTAPGATAVTAEPKAAATQAPTAAAPAAPADPNAVPAPADVAAPPADAEKTPSGLASRVLTPGTGKEHPSPDDTVKVNYTGWTKDGKMFDTSPEPIKFRLNQVIKGWTEGVALMTVGEKRRLWIPANLAYGERPRMGAPTGDLTFDVELLEIVAAPKPPPVPEDVKAAPATAKKTASGLAYRVLKKGTGKKSPKETDRVTVNYSGWTTDGKMFDSSITRGEPATFGVNQVIKGWTEGLQLMHEGDSVRLWIPGNMAYGDKPTRPGAPSGMLVFDIELIKIR